VAVATLGLQLVTLQAETDSIAADSSGARTQYSRSFTPSAARINVTSRISEAAIAELKATLREAILDSDDAAPLTDPGRGNWGSLAR
jgi:hypothetical protein